MLHRTAQLSVALFVALFPVLLSAQANQPTLYVFCAAQAPPAAPGAPGTVYYSGIMQGTAANLQNFRADFTQFLMQRYAYKGAAACAPSNSMANAQTQMNNQMTAFRNAKRNVVQTGWSEGGVLGGTTNPLGGVFGGGQPTTSAPANNAQRPATGSAGNQNSVSNVFGEIFGTSNGSAGGANGGAAAAGRGGQAGAAGGASQSPFSQVSGALNNVFGNKNGANGGANGGRGGQPGGQPGAGNNVVAGNGQPGASGGKPGQPAQPNAVLGSAQFGTTKLAIYGCGRQDMQVACVAELTNTNAKDTLVKSTDVWKDAFIVDDRGDRHMRSNAFFLNIDGEQRPQLDINNGKTAKFILMFDNVPTKVQTVALRSQNGNMDVENIGLIAADPSAPGTASASAPAQH